MTTQKKTQLDYLDSYQVARACRYWADYPNAEVVSMPTKNGGFHVRLRLEKGGDVILTKATARRGLKRLAAEAISLKTEERWRTTPYGTGVNRSDPGSAIDGFTRGGDEYVDVVMQYGAFGCLIFG